MEDFETVILNQGEGSKLKTDYLLSIQAAVYKSALQRVKEGESISEATDNAVNMQNSMNAFNMTSQANAFLWQEMRDQADHEFKAYEGDQSRKSAIIVADAMGNVHDVNSKAHEYFKEKYGELPQFKPLQKKIGLLSATFVLIIGVAILHWYQILHVDIRWLLFFIIMLVYFIILFRSVKTLSEIKISLNDSEVKKEK